MLREEVYARAWRASHNRKKENYRIIRITHTIQIAKKGRHRMATRKWTLQKKSSCAEFPLAQCHLLTYTVYSPAFKTNYQKEMQALSVSMISIPIYL